ncbi:PAS domain-containing sensor histidine kinase [Methanosarcina sp. T3]|uniref:PAS domain-containing sensor histidine kinase n=1 Tax=Methanosarcina sp. T3 TaxID=3439062 RepID=UPI003F86C983
MSVSGFDVSDQKDKEKLRDGEELYRALFENSNDAVLLTSPGGTVYTANPEACRIFGMTEEEIIRAGRSGVVDTSDPGLKLAFEGTGTGKFKGELNFRRKDGTIFPGELSTAFFSDKNGQVKTVMIIRDVTESKLVAEAMRKSEERYRMLFTNMTDASFLAEVIYDKDGTPCDYRFLEVNPAYERYTGLEKERLLGKTVLEVFPDASPIGLKEYEKVALSGVPTHYEVKRVEVGNRYFDVYAFNPENGKLALIFKDVAKSKQTREKVRKVHYYLEEKIVERTKELEKAYSSLKEKEESFAEAQKMAHVGNWNWDIATNKLLWSDELYRIFGLRPKEFEVTPNLFLTYVHPDDRDYADRAIKTALNGEPFDINYRIILADGSERAVHAKTEVIFDENNTPIRMRGTVQDITDIKQMEKALRESEEKYRNIVETANEGIFLMDAEFNVTYSNKRTAELMRYVQEEIIDRPVMDFICDESKPIAIRSLDKRRSGISESYELKLKCKDGSLFWAYISAKPLFDKNGIFTGSLCMFTDITKRKETEAKLKETLDNLENLVKVRTEELEIAFNSLRESERGLAEAQQMAHIGNWNRDIVTDKLFWSDELYRIFGLKPKEFEVTHSLFLTYVHSDDRNYVDTAFKTALKGEPLDIDYRIILADGSERVVHGEGEVIFDENNIPIRMRGTVQDITERKRAEEKLRESEEKYRNIVETANEGIFLMNSEFKITYANKRTMELMGHTHEETIGRPVMDFVCEESKPIAKKSLERRRSGISESYELKLKCKDGSLFWALISAKPFFNRNGDFSGSLCMYTDITKRKEAEEALANIEIARKKEIHHRIKNNLQIISSLLDLQAEKFKDREDIKDSEVLEAFRESQDRVISMALIHEELHRNEGLDKLNFSQYIKELADNLFLTYRLGNDGTRFSKDIEENIFFNMDTAVPLGIIINELVSNSLKYAFQGRERGEISVKLHREEDRECGTEDRNSAAYVLSVSDNGVGVPKELDIGNLDSLGLQLVTSLVEQLNGELELERNNGTEFTIRFTVIEMNNQASVPAQQ